MESTILLITGANSGIGYHTVGALNQSDRSYTILLGARSLSKAEQAIEQVKKQYPGSNSSIQPLVVDVCDDSSIKAAFDKVSGEFGKLDVLVNNAGTQFDSQIKNGTMTTRQAWAASWDVNVTGSHIMTQTFVPLLLKSKDPRVVFTTSGTSSLAETDDHEAFPNRAPAAGWPKDPNFPSIISYRSTKIGLNMLMREWKKVLRNDGVKLFCVAPGFLATGFGGQSVEAMKKAGAQEPSLGGISLREVVEGNRDADDGKVVRNYSSRVQPW